MEKFSQETGQTRAYRKIVAHTPRCHECNEEALGRCPDCRQSFCQEHFPKQQHSPCAEKQMRLAQTQVCYICGAQVYPDQWSLSRTSHCIDEFRCQGCGRHICDEQHTRRKTEHINVVREGVRGHRYQITTRYCALCSPLYRIGGINGLTRWLVVVATVAASAYFYFHP